MQKKEFVEERRRQIVTYIGENKRAEVPELAKLFKVTEVTIRRDLIVLEQEDKLIRTHGGAMTYQDRAIWQTTNLNTRMYAAIEEKKRIAEYVSILIHDGDSIFIDGGSTTLLTAQSLLKHKHLLVVTNSPLIAGTLAGINNNKVILTGGELEKATDSLLGPACEEAIKQYRTDKAILGVSGLIPYEGLFAAIPQEAVVKRLMMQNAKQVIIVTDSTKMRTAALCFVCDIKTPDILVTDISISNTDMSILKENNLDVYTV